MSVRAMARRWQTSQQISSALLLRLAIADHARDNGNGAYSTLAFLADKIRISKRHTLTTTNLTYERLPPRLADAARSVVVNLVTNDYRREQR